MPAARGASTPREAQPRVSVRTIANVSPMRPPVMRSAPATSKWRLEASAGLGGITRRPSTITAAPRGTLMAKIAGQPRPCVRSPPSSAPEEAPRAPIAPHIPTARLRSGPALKELVTIERVAGERIAPPKPWSARAPRSRPRLSARAQASEDSENSAAPAKKTRRRPSRSEQRPPSMRKPANVSV